MHHFSVSAFVSLYSLFVALLWQRNIPEEWDGLSSDPFALYFTTL
jgi:hypothetical protein